MKAPFKTMVLASYLIFSSHLDAAIMPTGDEDQDSRPVCLAQLLDTDINAERTRDIILDLYERLTQSLVYLFNQEAIKAMDPEMVLLNQSVSLANQIKDIVRTELDFRATQGGLFNAEDLTFLYAADAQAFARANTPSSHRLSKNIIETQIGLKALCTYLVVISQNSMHVPLKDLIIQAGLTINTIFNGLGEMLNQMHA